MRGEASFAVEDVHIRTFPASPVSPKGDVERPWSHRRAREREQGLPDVGAEREDVGGDVAPGEEASEGDKRPPGQRDDRDSRDLRTAPRSNRGTAPDACTGTAPPQGR